MATLLTRRTLLLGGGAALALAGLGAGSYFRVNADSGEVFEVTHSPEEWRAMLSDAQYAVLREEATEPPFTSPLNDEKRAGTFHCAGCDLPLYSSADKFDSGTGWPSFIRPLPDAVRNRQDFALVLPRTEEHCRRCGGHLGHVFDDGPPPTGKRHCINGVALTFRAA